MPKCMRYRRFQGRIRRRPPRPLLTLAALVACLLLAGCTIQDALRATLGGRDSNEAQLNRINPKNQVSFPIEK